MEPVRAVFESFKFSDLDRSWIDRAIESSFMEMDNAPADYLMFLESPDMAKLLKETCVVVKEWMSKNETEQPPELTSDSDVSSVPEVSWQTLLAFDIDVRALLAILAYLIKGGQESDADRCSRLSGTRATSLYFVLLTIPGSNAFRAFHPTLYEIALTTLTMTRRLSPIATGVSHHQQQQQHRTKITNSAEEDASFDYPLTKSESATLIAGLNGVMYDLLIMIKSARTTLEMNLLELTIRRLVETTKLANETVDEFRAMNEQTGFPSSLNSLSYNAYVALCRLCNPKYGSISVTTRLIAKYELENLLIGGSGGSGGSSSAIKQMTIVRESVIHFFKTLLEHHGNAAFSAVRTLIQHLMIKCPDRVEGRQRQAVVIIKLMNLTREGNGNVGGFWDSMRDLVLLSHHNKISSRIFAQEIIGKFLLDLRRVARPRSCCTSEEESSDTKKILLACALSRCVDSSSLVRGRALATLAEYTEAIEDELVCELFRRSRIARPDAIKEEMPSLEDLEEAIENRRNVDSVLPNVEGLMRMLRARAEDERALVRRSALETIRNGVLVSIELLNEAVDAIVEHCRDSAITVRRFAIHALTGLLEKFRDPPSSLLKHWVESVVPRVFDSEIKVREQVLESFWKLTIGSIIDGEAHSKNFSLPWKLIRELAYGRMMDHLCKACDNWIRSGRITDAIIATIESHVGTENETGAWLLLASIAETIKLTGMDKYYNYYEKSLVCNEKADIFLSCLIIQVLRYSWSNFETPILRRLQRVIIENIEQFRVDVALIGHSLDILDGITEHLERLDEIGETNETNRRATTFLMRDLVKLSESTIAREIERHDENRLNNDSGTLVFRATCTLGHASLLCTEKITLPTLRTLEGFLVEWASLPERLKSRKELQAAAVIVLGQQALRDREIAQEVTPILGRLLRNEATADDQMANGPAVRINAAKALADICVRFTALVDPYLPDMCVSMKDPNSDVRQVILVIFIQLLVEDFIMINGPFFFHIMTMLSDVDPTIRRMTIFLVNERLLTKNKKLVSQQFVNAIFHYNDCEKRNAGLRVQRRKIREKERRALVLPGDENRAKRRVIYDFMLQHLDPAAKLVVLVALTNQILNFRGSRRGKTAAAGGFDLNTNEGVCVVRDALYVAASEYINSNSSNGHAIDEDNDEQPTAVAEKSLGNSTGTNAGMIADAIKKHRLEVLLPNIVELKRYVTFLKSPLVADVTKFLIKMIAECTKEQLAAGIYSEYPKLERQIERDIRKYGEAASQCSMEKDAEEASLPRNEITKTSTSPRISTTLDKTSSLIDPNRTPRIVLRRLSSLTYPGISVKWDSPVNPRESADRIEKPTQVSPRRLRPHSRLRSGDSLK